LLFAVSKADLAAALDGRDQARARAVRRVLIDDASTQGTAPWAILAGDYMFDASSEDVAFLTGVARLAREAGAPFLAAARTRLLGANSLDATRGPDDWQRLDPEAADPEAAERWAALRTLGPALPRFLLRLP
jgi:type VI secretion system protein ImpC